MSKRQKYMQLSRCSKSISGDLLLRFNDTFNIKCHKILLRDLVMCRSAAEAAVSHLPFCLYTEHDAWVPSLLHTADGVALLIRTVERYLNC